VTAASARPQSGAEVMKMAKKNSQDVRRAVHERIRKRLAGTSERPRLAVFRSTNHIYAQVIDDTKGVTLTAASSNEPATRGQSGGNIAAAKEVGKLIAERAKEKGISRVVFDRGGYIYHGRVKGLAEAAREAGLEF
jgi:large subunit ribosomal protein L18